MDTLAPLVQTLHTKLGISPWSQPDSLQSELESVIMEGAITRFLATEGLATTATFLDWVETNQSATTTLQTTLEKFPQLMNAIHAELVEVIAGVPV